MATGKTNAGSVNGTEYNFRMGEISQVTSGDLNIPVKINANENFFVSYIAKITDITTEISSIQDQLIISAYRINGVEGCIEYDYGVVREETGGVLYVDSGEESTTLLHPFGFPETSPEYCWVYFIW